jgi:probable F420-dependent oxidoreductase
MRFVLQLPLGCASDPRAWLGGEQLGAVAAAAERVGFDALAVTDHPFPPDQFVRSGGHNSFDPFVALSFFAAATTRLRLLTNILVAGYRHPYVAASAAASLDQLSGGRLILGLAAGYLTEEFRVLAATFDGRAERLEATVLAMRAAWTGQPVREAPAPFEADGHVMRPVPWQEPGPPIWMGGNSAAARRRAARVADGWMPFAASRGLARVTGTAPMKTLADLKEAIAEVRGLREQLGRGPLAVCFGGFEGGKGADYCRALTDALPAYEDTGVDWLVVGPESPDLMRFRADLDDLASLIEAGHR